MLNALYQYLVLNDHVSIPGIGSFSVKRSPAVYSGTTIQPPAAEIVFQSGTSITEKQFYDFLAAHHNLSAVDAVRRFNDFAYQLKQQLSAQKMVELSGFGRLLKNAGGELVFESAVNTAEYFRPITPKRVETPSIQATVTTVSPVVDEEPDEVTRPADRWWITAIILAVVACAAIGFYFMTETGMQP